jgi:hypothetical protein
MSEIILGYLVLWFTTCVFSTLLRRVCKQRRQWQGRCARRRVRFTTCVLEGVVLAFLIWLCNML